MARRWSFAPILLSIGTSLVGCGNPHYTGELEPLDLVGVWTAQVKHEGRVLDSWLELKADGAFHGEQIPVDDGLSNIYLNATGVWEVQDVTYLGRSYLPRWHLRLKIPVVGEHLQYMRGYLWYIYGEELPNIMLAYTLDVNLGTRLVFHRANGHIRDFDEDEVD